MVRALPLLLVAVPACWLKQRKELILDMQACFPLGVMDQPGKVI